jgi:hypothetical protein
MGQDYTQRNPKKNSTALKSSAASGPEVEETSPLMMMQQTAGNQAVAEQTAQIQGPIGRVYNRILGLPETSQEGMNAGFSVTQLRSYLEHTLQLAKGEWFRGAKLSGVSEELMKTLDTDRNGLVGWTEFTVFQQQTLETIAPHLEEHGSVAGAAEAQFGEVDANNDQKVSYAEARDGILRDLPQETEHQDLIAQLGALIAMDAIDQDQQDEKARNRELTQDEWLNAAIAMADEDQKSP